MQTGPRNHKRTCGSTSGSAEPQTGLQKPKRVSEPTSGVMELQRDSLSSSLQRFLMCICCSMSCYLFFWMSLNIFGITWFTGFCISALDDAFMMVAAELALFGNWLGKFAQGAYFDEIAEGLATLSLLKTSEAVKSYSSYVWNDFVNILNIYLIYTRGA